MSPSGRGEKLYGDVESLNYVRLPVLHHKADGHGWGWAGGGA